MNMKKLKTVTLLCAIVFLSITSVVSARYYSGGYSFDVIGYNPYGAAEYVAAQAEDYWNDSEADTHIGAAPGSINPIYWNDYDYNWFGQYRPGTNQFSIRLNSRTLEQAAPGEGLTTYQMGINTAVHEFGHALHLAHPIDHEAAGNTTIMSYERDRSNNWPRSLDISNLQEYRGY